MAKRRLCGTQVLHILDNISSSDNDSDNNSDAESELDDASCDDDALESAGTVAESSDADEKPEPVTWKKLEPGASCNFKRLAFTVANTGSQVSDDLVPNDELAFFQLYFTDELILEFVVNTNAYAATKLANASLCPNSIWNKWSDVTADELKAYFGVNMNTLRGRS